MKLRHLVNGVRNEGEVIARFGEAALIRERDGKWQLRGGSRDDQLTAKEWISLFMHEVVVQINRTTDHPVAGKTTFAKSGAFCGHPIR